MTSTSGVAPGTAAPTGLLDLSRQDSLPRPRGVLARQFLHVVREARPRVQGVFILRFTCGAALTGAFTWQVLHGLTAWVAATLAIYVLNGVSDLEGDRRNGSKRPLARGDLAPESAQAWIAALALGAVAAGLLISTYFAMLVLAFLALGTYYSIGPRPAKQSTGASAAVVLGGGLLTYSAGHAATGQMVSPTLTVLAGAMSAWMIVGSIVKDLPDLAGDAASGRRTLALRRGTTAAAKTACLVAASISTISWWSASSLAITELYVMSAVLGGGSACLIIICSLQRRFSLRAPYRTFMATQYIAHGAVLACL